MELRFQISDLGLQSITDQNNDNSRSQRSEV